MIQRTFCLKGLKSTILKFILCTYFFFHLQPRNSQSSSKSDICRINPFKCPPKTRAGGKKPRVKSDIKARRRNYYHPSTSKTNRIRGKPSFNQFVKGNLRTRTGKAQRGRPFEKVNANVGGENNFFQPAASPKAQKDVVTKPFITSTQQPTPSSPSRSRLQSSSLGASARVTTPTPTQRPFTIQNTTPANTRNRQQPFIQSTTPTPTRSRQPSQRPFIQNTSPNTRSRQPFSIQSSTPTPNTRSRQPSQRPFVQSTTESLLQSLLHQIEEEKKNSPPGTEPLIFRRPDQTSSDFTSTSNRRPELPRRPPLSQRPRQPSAAAVTPAPAPPLFNEPPPSVIRQESIFDSFPRQNDNNDDFILSSTTRRTPRVKSNILANKANNGGGGSRKHQNKRPLPFNFDEVVRRPLEPPQRQPQLQPVTPAPPPPPAIHFTTSTPATFSIISTSVSSNFSPTPRPFSSGVSSSTPRSGKKLSTTNNSNFFNAGRAISTTTSSPSEDYEYEYEYEYYYDDDDDVEYYEDEDYLAPPPLPTISTQPPNLVSQIPLVSMPIPQTTKQPVTLAERPTTAADPQLPPIPTFSPNQLRKTRIQSHRVAAPRPPKNFPLFNTKNSKKKNNNKNFVKSTDNLPSSSPKVVPPKISSDGRTPRVKSNLKQAERDRGNNRFSKNEFRRKILRNRQRFDTVDFEENEEQNRRNNDNNVNKQLSLTSNEEPEITTARPSFADLFSSDLIVKPDGRSPRVKSNIKQKLAHNGKPFAKSHKIPVPSDLFEPKNVDKRRIDAGASPSDVHDDDDEKGGKIQNLLTSNVKQHDEDDDENNEKSTSSIMTTIKQAFSSGASLFKKAFSRENYSNKNNNNDDNNNLKAQAEKQGAKFLAQLAKSGKLDPIKINQSSGDNEPVVRPDGQKPRVKSNILASHRNKGGSGQSNEKNSDKNASGGFFRHSKKVESAEFVFEPTTLRSLDLLTTTEEPSILVMTTSITEKARENSKTTTTEVPVSSTPPTSLLDVFLSTQVLNTRAVDPTLASLHEKMKEEFQQNKRSRVKRKKRKSVKKELDDDVKEELSINNNSDFTKKNNYEHNNQQQNHPTTTTTQV